MRSECRSERLSSAARQDDEGKVDMTGKRSRKAALGATLVGLVAGLALVIAGSAVADHDYDGKALTHELRVHENPTCPGGTADAGSLTIDGAQLVTGYSDAIIDIPFRGGDPDSFAWHIHDSFKHVMAVIVKGGDNAYIYYYGADAFSDQGVTPPVNDGGQHPQISHVTFCFDPKNEPDAQLTVAKTASGTSKIQHSWEIDKQVKLAGASDATYGDNAVLNLADGGSGSVTWKVVVTHSQTQTYAVTGTITVSNDTGSPIGGVAVTDSIPGAVTFRRTARSSAPTASHPARRFRTTRPRQRGTTSPRARWPPSSGPLRPRSAFRRPSRTAARSTSRSISAI
jgi:uncharacterized repeat protein (TIGR01451 family)